MKYISLFLSIVFLFSINCSGGYEMSDHYDGKVFFDPVNNNDKGFLDVIKWMIKRKPAKWPDKIELESTDLPPRRVYGSDLRVSNVGHVTFLLQTQGLNILTDPVWSKRASPFSFVGPKRVVKPGINFDDLPPIDIVWISHNHYDHLDLETINNLWQKHKPRIITPLGNETIIKSHNDQIKVEAYDWGALVNINDNVKFHITPMQHWSARGVFDRNKALWAALVIETSSGNIYFVGDSGYGSGRYFQADKKRFGSFRLALLPMGAYEPRWFMQYAHMSPEEMVQAYLDLGQPYTIPSHYDVFQLTDEGYGVAITELQKAQIKLQTGSNIKLLKVGHSWQVPELQN